MMCVKLLRHKPGSHQSALFRASEAVFEGVIWLYGKTLKVVLRHQVTTQLVSLVTLAATVYLYLIVPKGFFPVQDTGVILGISEAPQDVSFDAMTARQRELNRKILEDDSVESLSSFIGVDGTNTTMNTGRIQINLKPLAERKISASEVITRLQPRLEGVEGINLFMQPVQDLTVETRISRTQYQYSLEDPNERELAEWVPRFMRKLHTLAQLRDVASDQLNFGLQAKVVIDRDTASRFGITPQSVDDALYDAFGQRQISIMFTQLNQYRLILEVKPEFKNDPSDLSEIYVRSPTGGMVPLKTFTRVDNETSPLTINHQGQFPVVTVSFNLAPGVSLGEAVEAIAKAKAELNMPPSIVTGFQGTAEAFQASLKNTPLLILAALVTVYIVLGVLYESYIHPITILSTLPSAGVGALAALILFKTDLSVIALIGIILLIGIVKKNAIMMIDFALDAQRTQGMPPEEAIYQACLLRFRPIMMTTMAALLGAVPLAIGLGVGSELRRPLGITIIGGLIFSQILTLYTTPVVYLWFDWLAHLIGFSTAPIVKDEEVE
jgi:multidrug efflux pump